MITKIGASAPGKLMVSGEYAVLEGAVAVVASVGVRVSARWVDEASRPLPPEAQKTRELAEQALGAIDGALTIDATALRSDGMKLGLGSSAAASAAVAGALLASHGHDLSRPEVQKRALDLALAGHKAIAPEGSGADVAAASLGGFVRFRLDSPLTRGGAARFAGGTLAEAERIAFPEALAKRVVWTRQEARTSEFVRAVRAFEERDARGYALVRDALHAHAAHFAEAIAKQDLIAILGAADHYGQAMGALGDAAGVPIMTPELRRIAELAREHGGAAKPSGAGGGDVAIAFFPDADRATAFDRACANAALTPLDLTLGAPGVRAD